MLKLVIGNKNLSSWSLRPWLLMKHVGIEFEEHVVLFEEDNWREKILAHSPSRKVPALRDGDVVIWDSLAICEYVAELHPTANLWPADRTTRAIARSMCAEMHSGFANVRKHLSMDVTARIPRTTRSHETQTEIDRIVQLWSDARSRVGSSSGPFLFGHFTIADAMYAPIVWRFRTYDVPVVGDEARAWYEMMLELPAMKAWERDAVAEVQAMPKRLTPPAPGSASHCFAVIFSSQHAAGAPEGYEEAAEQMVALAKNQPGFMGIESARNPDGFGITVSYWDSLESIAKWKAQADHAKVQAKARESFYSRYEVRVCTVERGYKFER